MIQRFTAQELERDYGITNNLCNGYEVEQLEANIADANKLIAHLKGSSFEKEHKLEAERDKLKAELEKDRVGKDFIISRWRFPTNGRVAKWITRARENLHKFLDVQAKLKREQATLIKVMRINLIYPLGDNVIAEFEKLKAEIESHGPEGRNVTNAQYGDLRNKLLRAESTVRELAEKCAHKPCEYCAHKKPCDKNHRECVEWQIADTYAIVDSRKEEEGK